MFAARYFKRSTDVFLIDQVQEPGHSGKFVGSGDGHNGRSLSFFWGVVLDQLGQLGVNTRGIHETILNHETLHRITLEISHLSGQPILLQALRCGPGTRTKLQSFLLTPGKSPCLNPTKPVISPAKPPGESIKQLPPTRMVPSLHTSSEPSAASVA